MPDCLNLKIGGFPFGISPKVWLIKDDQIYRSTTWNIICLSPNFDSTMKATYFDFEF